MAHIVGAREKLWHVLYDTICFGEGFPPERTRTLTNSQRLFAQTGFDGHYSNCYCAGQMPAGQSFKLTELGLRVDMDGPIADDMLHAMLRALQLKLIVGNKECVTIPPGGFYPPGMTETVAGFLARSEKHRAEMEQEEGVSIEPLVRRCEDRDESAEVWANDLNVPGCGHMFFPSEHGYEVGSRNEISIQLRLMNGQVWFEQSNDGEDWLGITPALIDLARGGPLGLYDDSEIKSIEGEVRDFLLACDCRARYLRGRWEPKSETNVLQVRALARGRDVLLPSDHDDVEPPWLRGGFCRFVPVRPGITLLSHQNFYVELTFGGAGSRRMEAAAREELLRGEVSVLLGGVLIRDIR